MTAAVKAYMIIVGIILYIVNIIAMGKRKMRPSFGVTWSIVALVPIVTGIILRMDVLERYMSWKAVIAAFLGGTALVIVFYSSTLYISELRNQTQELFMQVALLNEENSRLRKAAEKREAEKERRALMKQRKDEEQRTAAETERAAESCGEEKK